VKGSVSTTKGVYSITVTDTCDKGLTRPFIMEEDFFGKSHTMYGKWVNNGKSTVSTSGTLYCHGYEFDYQAHDYIVESTC
jgi:hypothetical protein